ncbi:type VII secretion system-associated protein [Streptomyces sp. TLI_105]|uniref:type VII secretion system-associated protein n=1 Tax=Streptomyces sp. TLI_105 TaxID=1881019 RepID=UPI00089B5C9C|nr:type VII secretion system-associated protein [Streptomyces sp. TLI_105]SEE62182.1 Tetratricopeptide repeat-containing protein [Streptomyces sp. TLI_105]
MTPESSPAGGRWVAAEHIIDSVVVTGDGNIVIYYADGGQAEPAAPGSRADAERLLFGPEPIASASRPWTWLAPETALHPLVSRPEEADLVEWAREGRDTVARLVCAPSGQGKTTLARQVCAQLRDLGWTAGILDLERASAPHTAGAASMVSSLSRAARRWDRQLAAVAALPRLSGRALLVIDSAEVHRSRIEELLHTITELPAVHEVPPVKLLLLARDTGEWWEELSVGSHRHHWIERQVARLPPLTEGMGVTELDALWRDATGGFLQAAKQAGMSVAASSAHGIGDDRPTTVPTTLHLYAAALLRVLDAVEGRTTSLHDREHPITGLVEHEQRYVAGVLTAAGLPVGHEHARLLLALVCLHAPSDEPSALRTLRRVDKTTPDDDLARMARELQVIYPDGDRSLWKAPGPDRLADSVLHTLAADSRSDGEAEHLLRALCTTDDWFEGRDCARVLIRALATADEEPTTLAEVSRCLDSVVRTLILEHPRGFAPAALDTAPERFEQQILAAVAAGGTASDMSGLAFSELEALDLLVGSAPAGNSRTRICLAISGKLLHSERLAWLGTGPWQTSDRLARLAQYARDLRRIDDVQGASRAAEEAVALVRRMCESGEAAASGHIALRMSRASGNLATAGQNDAALVLSTAAAESAWATLSSPDPLNTAQRAAVLNQHSQRLFDVGQTAAAANCSGEALQLYHDAAESDPGRHDLELTAAMADYGMKLRAVGRPQQAAPHLAEALSAYRRHLAVDDRPGTRYGLVRTLRSYGAVLCDLGRADQAVPHVEEAVNVQRGLAALDPDAVLDLAAALGQSGATFAETGSAEAARRELEEAVDILRSLHGEPRAAGELASALANLGAWHGEFGDAAHAVSLLEEALALKEDQDRGLEETVDDIKATAHNLSLALRRSREDARAQEVRARYHLDTRQEEPSMPGIRTADEVKAEIPPVTEEMRAAARRMPGGYLYAVDPAFDPQGEVPGHGIRGAFRIDADGEITDYMANERYRPTPVALCFPPATDAVDEAAQLASTGYGSQEAVVQALESATVAVAGPALSRKMFRRKPRETAIFTAPIHMSEGVATTRMSGAELLSALPQQAVIHINPGSPGAYRLNRSDETTPFPAPAKTAHPTAPPSSPTPFSPSPLASPPSAPPEDEVAQLCALHAAGEPVLGQLTATLRRSRVWYVTGGDERRRLVVAQAYDGRSVVFVYSSRAYASASGGLDFVEGGRLSEGTMSDLLKQIPSSTYVVINNEGPHPLQIAASALLAYG